MARTLNLFVDRGVSWSQNVIAYTSNSSGKYPVNLDYYHTAVGRVRKSYANSTVAAAFTLGGSTAKGIHDANTSGAIQLKLANTVTAGLIEGRYVYDIELVCNTTFASLTGNEWKDYPNYRVCEGILTVNPTTTSS